MRKAGAAGRPRQAPPPEAEATSAADAETASTAEAETATASVAEAETASASVAEAETVSVAEAETADVAAVEAAERQPWPGWDPTVRLAGVVVAVVAAFVTGILELVLSTLRAGDLTTIWRGEPIGSGGGPPLGLSIVLAAVANYAISWFAVSTTRRRWAMGPPWLLWTLMMLFAAGVRTDEGDYLLAGNDWVALVMILVGSLSFAVYSYRLILKRTLN